jgi:hypothetical protein
MSRFADAVHAWMRRANRPEISSNELWVALSETNPELTTVRENRKTPRTTMMRDLRKDGRFLVANRTVKLKD